MKLFYLRVVRSLSIDNRETHSIIYIHKFVRLFPFETSSPFHVKYNFLNHISQNSHVDFISFRSSTQKNQDGRICANTCKHDNINRKLIYIDK